tara:strand:+ start:266 stop:367 length:102 start_codon:yes stop_codon:yes gene_type:complete
MDGLKDIPKKEEGGFLNATGTMAASIFQKNFKF